MTDARRRRLDVHRAFEREPLPGVDGRASGPGRRRDSATTRPSSSSSPGDQLTFRELKERADRLAAALARLGVVKGTHVALMVPNGPPFPVTWLALARLGAVMIPVNNRYTARELGYVLRDADADFLVIHSDYLPVLEGVDRAATAIAEDRVIVVGERPGGPGHHWDALIAAATRRLRAARAPNAWTTSSTSSTPRARPGSPRGACRPIATG